MLRLAKGRLKGALQDVHQLALPPSFLCPSWNHLNTVPIRPRGVQHASTSYAAPISDSPKGNGSNEYIPSQRKARYDFEPESTTRTREGLVPIQSEQNFSFDLHSHSLSHIELTEPGRWRSDKVGGMGGEDDNGGKGKGIEISAQDVLLGQAFVRDILQKPPDLIDFSIEVELLDEVQHTYSEYGKSHPRILDEVMPELALAYLHLENDQKALDLLGRTREVYLNYISHTSTPLHAWKSVLATAFRQKKYHLTAQLAEIGGAGKNSEDDWAMYARFDALVLQSRSSKHTGDLKSTYRYWNEFEKFGRVAPDQIFGKLLKEQVGLGDVAAIMDTLVAKRDHGHAIDESTLRYLLQIHPRGRSRGILGKYLTQLNFDVQKVFEDIVTFFTVRKDVRRVILAFRMFGVGEDMTLEKAGWTPSLNTLQAFIKLLCNQGKIESAMVLLRLSSVLQVKGNYTQIFLDLSRLLRKLGRPDDALELCQQMINTPFAYYTKTLSINLHLAEPLLLPSRRAYSECLEVCASFSDPIKAVEKARQVMLNVFANDIRATAKVRKGLIDVFQAIMVDADWEHITSFLESISKSATERSQEYDDHELRRFIDGLNSYGAFDRIIAANREMPFEDSRDARENLQWVIKTSDVPNSLPSAPNFSRDIETEKFSLSAQQRAAILFEEEGLSADPNVHLTPRLTSTAYALRLRVFAVIRQDYGSAIVIYRYMLSQGIKPTSHHIAPIIEGLVMNDRLEDAHAIRDGARQTLSDINSSIRISTAIIRGHLQRSDWSGIHEELRLMRKKRIHPDSFILSMLQMAKRYQLWESSHKNKNLDKHNKEAQRIVLSFMDPTRKGLEDEITERYDNGTAIDEGKDAKSSTVETVDLSVKNLTVQRATAVYQYLAYHRRHLLAAQYLSKALEAGIKPDNVLGNVIRRQLNSLKRDLQREGLDYRKLMEREDPDSNVTVDQVDHFMPEDESKGAIQRAKVLTWRRAQLANHYARILKLCLENRAKANRNNPARLEEQERASQARTAMLQLILDVYAGSTLKDEAKARLKGRIFESDCHPSSVVESNILSSSTST